MKFSTLSVYPYIRLVYNATRLYSTQSLKSSGPLEGIRILDLTRIVAGPFCTMMLGDLGADVYKIERPHSGDECRKWGPPFIETPNSKESCYFVSLNRNKKSICLDIKKGRDVIYDLARKCDVLVENFIPGNLDKLELGYEHLKKINPKLIYCSITGYGAEGPYKNKPGYDVIAASIGGLLHITGPKDGEPSKVGVAVTDIATGLLAHGAIMASLIKRSKTNHGEKIDCNLLSTQLASLINIGSNYLNAGVEGKRWGTAHESIVPYEAFATKDGYFTIGTGSDQQYFDLCDLIGRSDLKQYKTNNIRVEVREKLLEVLKGILKTKTNKEWSRIFENASFPCGPVNSLEEAFNDPHVKATNIVKEVDHPNTGKIKMVGHPVKYGEYRDFIRLPPPQLGEHTEEVLRDLLKYDEKKIEDLRKKNIAL